MSLRVTGGLLFLSQLLVASGAPSYPDIPTKPTAGDRMLANYFEAETAKVEAASLAGIKTAEDWNQSKDLRRAQLREMLGLDPMPERTPLKAEVTGSQAHDGIVVENVVFQSRPGLYVTGNFYRPAEQGGALPAILYVCGHSRQKADGVSFGNKTAYHHHGVWFAKHGYVCLTIDTVQLGEIEGIHHGTYREGRWWWNARGYSSAAVEAWNGIRAIDYLETRSEADMQKVGITGRSGGGAYSWWVSALDERVKVAVPVAGIASLRNHVVDGCVEGHCDCMYHVNTYRWDFAEVAALVAPRPLLIANTDKDGIFPLDGVVDVYTKTRRIYKLLGAEKNIGLAIAEGPHKDTQPLRTEAFHWFERHLKGRASTDEIDTEAPKVLDRTTMRALSTIPTDEIVTKVDETFVKFAPAPELPADKAAWAQMRDGWMTNLREKCFRGWPGEAGDLAVKRLGGKEHGGVEVGIYRFGSQKPFRFPLIVAEPTAGVERVVLMAVDEAGWEKWTKRGAADFSALRKRAAEGGKTAFVLFAPRGVGATAWTSDERERVQVRRRFMLLGQTLDGMRVWDIRRSIAAVREIETLAELPLTIEAENAMACNVLYASLFEDDLRSLELANLPVSHRGGAIYLNVLRYLDVPAAAAMAAERCPISLHGADVDAWSFASSASEKLGWGENFAFAGD